MNGDHRLLGFGGVVKDRGLLVWKSAVLRFWRGLQWLKLRPRAVFWAVGVSIDVALLVGLQVAGGASRYGKHHAALAPLLTLAAGVSVAAVALARHFAQTDADRQRRITESFAKAVEQLGSNKLEMRLGGIYALGRISKESLDDYWTIMKNLTAFVRERSRRNEAERTALDSEQRVSRHGYFLRGDAGRPDGRAEEFWAEAVMHEELGEPPATDIVAVLTVLKSGYDGPSLGCSLAHDSVHRFAKAWRNERARVPVQAFVPLSFAPGEAYQFDWSHETITLRGLPLTIKAAHMKLSHSRMPFVRTYFRETQELVFDAHDKAFLFYGGVCRRGIYDNMKTAVGAIFVGEACQYHRRFLQMCSHHLIEPVACTPASGWEKGQVENQVGNLRDLLFRPKPRVKSLAELNAWLEDQCIAEPVLGRAKPDPWARRTNHPEFKDRTIWDVFQDERARLMELRGPFDGFVEKAVRATTTFLIMADHNRYSVDAKAAGRMVLVRSHAERVVVLFNDEVVADHPREFRRDQVIYDPWHYLPVLVRNPPVAIPSCSARRNLGLHPPGALRNGAPFKDWARLAKVPPARLVECQTRAYLPPWLRCARS
jgi:hypothetical protein